MEPTNISKNEGVRATLSKSVLKGLGGIQNRLEEAYNRGGRVTEVMDIIDRAGTRIDRTGRRIHSLAQPMISRLGQNLNRETVDNAIGEILSPASGRALLTSLAVLAGVAINAQNGNILGNHHLGNVIEGVSLITPTIINLIGEAQTIRREEVSLPVAIVRAELPMLTWIAGRIISY